MKKFFSWLNKQSGPMGLVAEARMIAFWVLPLLLIAVLAIIVYEDVFLWLG